MTPGSCPARFPGRALLYIGPWLAVPVALAIIWGVRGVPASGCDGFCFLAAPAAYFALLLYASLACVLSVAIAAAMATSGRVRGSGRPVLIAGAAGSIPMIALAIASLWLISQALA
jgi:hypothetical protein